MSRKQKDGLWHCDVCNRPMNTPGDLTPMHKPGVADPLEICAAGGCWDNAAKRGYKSQYQT